MSVRGASAGNERQKTADLVFQGGGVKGIGLVGAYSVLEERGYRPVNMAGASAGAIVAALVAAGYSAEELRGIMMKIPFHEFMDEAWEDRIWLLARPLSLLKDKGVYEGKYFHDWIKKLLSRKMGKEEVTFGDLRRHDVPEDADPVFHYKLQVIVSDVTERRMVVLPRDYKDLGWAHPDNVPVALAVRMSMSIPIFFEPVPLVNQYTGREHTIVDGGMLSNFPVWLFDAPPGQEAKRETFGLKLIQKDTRSQLVPQDFDLKSEFMEMLKRSETLGYFWSLVETMMEAHDRFYIEQEKFDKTIDIDTRGVGTTEFGLSPERKKELYESGREEARKFLDRIESKTPPAEAPAAPQS
ncbi:patatin-like phospholipase family protein [soil metagenome]